MAIMPMVFGCSPDGDPAQQSADDAPAASSGAVEVVQSYIDALRTGDVEAAVQYRCSAAEDLPVDIATQQIDRLFGLMGAVEAVEVGEVERTGVMPVDDLPGPVEVGYQLVIDGERHSEMLAVTVLEDGERRWCGRATSAASRIVSERLDALVAQPTTGHRRPDRADAGDGATRRDLAAG